VGFKTLVIGGLLILGTFLVVDRQISLGQFVATEIIIVLLTSSVEKLIQSIDTIFDSLTAVEKLGYVTDMPLEREHGFRFKPSDQSRGLHLQVSDLKYRYPGNDKYSLDGISFELAPHESLCVTGSNGSGKNTLFRVLSGMLTDYRGGIQFNGISLKDLNVVSLRSYMEQNSTIDDIFEGSILQNITMGREEISLSDLEWVLNALNLNMEISKLKDGLSSQMLPGGRRYSESFITKITLARCMVSRPRVLMLDDTLQNLHTKEKKRIIDLLTDKNSPWSLIILSNDPFIMQACDRVLVLNEGKVVTTGPFEEIKEQPAFHAQLEESRA
jgi:ABC-type bacteriocin/lantibiotic exporter with double-glycine peptidase domain